MFDIELLKTGYLVGELLHPPLIFADTLNSISPTSLLSFNLCLQLTHLHKQGSS